MWKPGLIEDSIDSITKSNENVTVINEFEVENCTYWYIRFDLDFSRSVMNTYGIFIRADLFKELYLFKVLACGNEIGKIYVWDLEIDDITQAKLV